MKVTSFEISQKLAEIGFDKKVGFLDYYYNTEGQLRNKDQEKYYEEENTDVNCFSYDLETILDALPKEILILGSWFELFFKKDRIFYRIYHDDGGVETALVRVKDQNESLADTAARLLIKLHEAGLVKFEEE